MIAWGRAQTLVKCRVQQPHWPEPSFSTDAPCWKVWSAAIKNHFHEEECNYACQVFLQLHKKGGRKKKKPIWLGPLGLAFFSNKPADAGCFYFSIKVTAANRRRRQFEIEMQAHRLQIEVEAAASLYKWSSSQVKFFWMIRKCWICYYLIQRLSSILGSCQSLTPNSSWITNHTDQP